MTNSRFPLVVQFLLAGAAITGTVDLLEERRRLVDLLNGQSSLALGSVQLALPGSPTLKSLPSMHLSKPSILVAIPRETTAQSKMRSMQTSMVGRLSTMQARMAILVPPFLIEGTAHGPGGSAKLTPEPAIFPRFFSVTDSRLTMPDGSTQDIPVALVHRDAVAAMSLLSDTVRPAESRPSSLPPSLLDRLISDS